MILWCCYVRGTGDFHAAPDLITALTWADQCTEVDRDMTANNFTPYLDAVPWPWPHSDEAHARDLPRSVEYFSVPMGKVAA